MIKKQSKPFTEDSLKEMGMVEISPGVYRKQSDVFSGKTIDIKKPNNPLRNNSNKLVHTNFIVTAANGFIEGIFCRIEIPGIVPGLNGNKGLIRSHWSNVGRQKKLYCQIIRSQLPSNYSKYRPVFLGAVTVEYVLHKTSLYDWDNAAASFKHIGDSLVKCGIIKDDKPKIIREFTPKQIKCKPKEQKVIIIIKAFKE